MFVRSKKLFDNISAAQDPGVVLVDQDYRLRDWQRDELSLQVIHRSGAPTYSIQVLQSMDGTNYVTVGSAIVAAGLTTITGIKCPYVRVDVDSLSGGNIDVYAG
jgi:hypothetical protein